MPRVTYIEHDGREFVVEVPVGESLMLGAVNNGVPGIDGDCGGNCACATCHVYVDEAWTAKAGARDEMETQMLDMAEGLQDNSRLACQIHMTADLDGIVLRLPEAQH